MLNWRNLLSEVAWSRVDSQRDLAIGEIPTEAYNDLRVHLAYELNLGSNRSDLFLTGAI